MDSIRPRFNAERSAMRVVRKSEHDEGPEDESGGREDSEQEKGQKKEQEQGAKMSPEALAALSGGREHRPRVHYVSPEQLMNG